MHVERHRWYKSRYLSARCAPFELSVKEGFIEAKQGPTGTHPFPSSEALFTKQLSEGLGDVVCQTP